jgi:hypothetical protein
MFCYDKVSGQSHPTSTKAAAQEAYFYEIPPTTGLHVPVNTVEKALGAFETAWGPLLADFIKSADAGGITNQQALEFAPFLVMQWMRTKTYRGMAHELLKRFGQAQVDQLAEANELGMSPTFCVEKEGLPALHAQQIFDLDRVQYMARALEWHFWVIGINDTAHTFYTSDHPVVRRGNRKSDTDGRTLLGAEDPGIEFAFPLDSRHILLILERAHFAEWRRHDNKAVPLSAEQVRDYNGLQVMRSCQRVYCANDDFDVARRVCEDHPEVRDPDRQRFHVENTPIVNLRSQTIATALE